MRTNKQNPFVWNEVKPELCYGRDALLQDLLAGLSGAQRVHFALAGGRRMGKSTILRRIEQALQTKQTTEIIPIYIDGLALPRPLTANDIWHSLIRELHNVLQIPSLEVSHTLDFYNFKTILTPILNSLAVPPRIIVLFDELEPIIACDWGRGFLANWRSLLELTRYFTAIFSGAVDLDILRYDVGSPLANILEWRSLRCLNFEDACHLMQDPIQRNWPEQFLRLVYQQSGGHPFLIQYIMQQVCNLPNSSDEESLQAVTQAVKKFAKERSEQFNYWWTRSCTSDARQVYSRFPNDGSTLTRRTLTREFGKAEAEYALEILQHVGLATTEDDGFTFHYNGEMFRQWYYQNVVEDDSVE